MSSDKKKDLTRIEDLAEFLHDENEQDFTDFTSQEEQPSSQTDEELPPDLSFETENTFGSTEDSIFGEPEFNAEESLSFSTEEESPIENNEIQELVDETFTLSTPDITEAPALSVELPPIDEDEPQVDFSKTEIERLPEPEPIIPAYKTPETFEDVKHFAESSNLTGAAVEGNPSFSVLLKNVKYIEDVNDIVLLLKEYQLLTDSEESTRARLERGHLLIPRISEYAAILLTHKFRRFDLEILMGLSDEIHPPKHYEAPETGLVSKSSLYQNQAHQFYFDHPKLELSQVLVSASPTLQNHQIIQYMGVATEHQTISAEIVEDENSSEIPHFYRELAQKLRAHAIKNHSNAVVGINYQLTPIPTEHSDRGRKYLLSCTGNLVWVNKL